MSRKTNFITMIENDLNSSNSIAHAYAIRACCINGFSTPSIISALKKLQVSSEKAMWQNISKAATAALHLIGAELYNGDDPTILEIIKTKYYSTVQDQTTQPNNQPNNQPL